MSNFIEELYFGKINPQECRSNSNEATEEYLDVISELEDEITEALAESDTLYKFLDFSNTWGIYNAETNLENFISGFRLGAKFVYDTFIDKNHIDEELLD